MLTQYVTIPEKYNQGQMQHNTNISKKLTNLTKEIYQSLAEIGHKSIS
jgi:hypothetical protein